MRVLCMVPMYHAMAQTIFGVTSPWLGIPTYVMQKFEFERMLEYIERYKITNLSLVPPILVGMAKHPDVKRWKWDLSSIREVSVGAAPLGRPACEEFEALWTGRGHDGQVNVRQGWGMTE